MRTIEGRSRYSRFGYAMANLGDINGDGFDGNACMHAKLMIIVKYNVNLLL